MARPIATVLTGLLIVLFAGCSIGDAGPLPAAAPSDGPANAPSRIASSATQRSEGAVTVEATWSGPASGGVFELRLDTHTMDLDGLDLSDTILRNDRGETLTARPWSAPPGGHHRAGSLAFNGDAGPLIADARWIELVVTDIGNTPVRILRWELGK